LLATQQTHRTYEKNMVCPPEENNKKLAASSTDKAPHQQHLYNPKATTT